MSDVNYSDDPSALTPASLAAIRNRLQPQVMLQPVDHDPFAEVPGVGVVPTAVPAAARAVGEGMASWAAAPGNVYRGQQPQVPGQWSDEDEARAQLNASGQYQWGPETATMMVGGGSPFAEEGAIGTAGGKLARSALPMDEASRMARAAEQGYTIDAFHGTQTPQEITEFQTGNIYNEQGDLIHQGSLDPNAFLGPHFAKEPSVANKFAAGKGAIGYGDWLTSRFAEGNPAVYPVKLQGTNIRKFDSEDDLSAHLYRQNANSPEIDSILENDHDGDLDAGGEKYDSDPKYRAEVNRQAVLKEAGYDEPSSETAQQLADGFRGELDKHGVTLLQYPNEVEGGTSYVSLAPPRSRFAAFDPANADKDFLLGSGSTDKRLSGALTGLNATQGIRAYHGSPYDFERFDLSKIGTGEGAQAYGHGLYFAENPAVAQSYKESLEQPTATGFLDKVSGETISRDELVNKIRQETGAVKAPSDLIQGWTESAANRLLNNQPGIPEYASNFSGDERKALEHIFTTASRFEPQYQRGKTYEVNINADPEHFLDWDKPLSEQPHILEKAPQLVEAAKQEAYSRALGATHQDRADQLWAMVKDPTQATGEFAMRGFAGGDRPSAEDITAKLRDAGIPGIKYLDQGSRGQGAGTSNYVVFNDKLIDIVK